MAAKFAVRAGAPFRQKDADVIAPEILRLAQNRGDGITKEELLEAARPPRSRLHRYFDWDDKKAAEKWRLKQAGSMLRAFEVIYTVNREERRVNIVEYIVHREEPEPVAVGADDEPEVRPQRRGREAPRSHLRRSYVPITEVLSDAELSQQLVQRARRELQTFRNKYERIRDYVDFRTKFGRAFAQICELIPLTQDE